MSTYSRISVETAEAMLAQHQNIMLLDMRDVRSFCQGHHPRAIHLNNSSLYSLLKHVPETMYILIYCYHGNSSQERAQMFADFDFTSCYSVDGGYEAWQQVMEARKAMAA